MKLTTRTFTIVYLTAVTGIICNNSQEAAGIAVIKTGARLPKFKS